MIAVLFLVPPRTRDERTAAPIVTPAQRAGEAGPSPQSDFPGGRGESFAALIEPICQATEIESATTFSVAGRKFVLPLSRGEPGTALVERLHQIFYGHFYCCPGFAGAPEEKAIVPPADPAYVRQLLTAAAGRERWEQGWHATHALGGGVILAGKKGFTRAFAPGEYSPAPGGSLRVRLAAGSLADQPDFFYCHGTRYQGDWHAERILRFYLNLPSEAVLRLVANLPARLELFQIPFHLKTLLSPAALEKRSDGTVLFVMRRHFPVAARILLDLADGARDPIPLFTCRLAAGIGFTEDPGESFGASRCRLLAEGLWNAFDSGSSDKVATIRQVFEARGLDPERPHLGPGSAGFYPLPSLAEGPAP